MDYLDFICKKIENIDCESIKGTCYSMCPPDEVTMREKERLVHVLEVMGPIRKLVKEYSRSAADSNMAVPRHLRPYGVLRDTVQYLLLEVTKRKDVSIQMMYNFVNDRLRAVRQDMTIQRLPAQECINLLEPMIRFHVYYGYILCELPIKDYDPVLNKKYLLECLKWFLSCSDTVALTQNGEKVVEITNFFSGLGINDKIKLKCDRVLMECLYLLCNLDDIHPLFRYLSLPKPLKSEPTLQLAYKISIANLNGNYIQVCRLLERLCPLTYCALCIHLPIIQRRALHVMSHAYSSRTQAVPLEALRRWLRLPGAACDHYGLRLDAGVVRFSKAEFNSEAAILQPKKQLLLDGRHSFTIDHVFTYTS